MGRSMTEWVDRVNALLVDLDEVDTGPTMVSQVGIIPALSQYAIDAPNVVAVDVTPVSRWLPLPGSADGWVAGWSRVMSLATPADEDPPNYLEPGEWTFARDPSDPSVLRILLPSAPASGVQVRVEFTSVWPTPTTDSTVDLVSTVAFDAVTSLAASMVLTALATEASRHRSGAMVSDFVDGTDRARDLLEAARSLRVLYNTFIGLGASTGMADAGANSDRVLRSTKIQSR